MINTGLSWMFPTGPECYSNDKSKQNNRNNYTKGLSYKPSSTYPEYLNCSIQGRMCTINICTFHMCVYVCVSVA